MRYIFLLLFTLSLNAHQLRENYLHVNYNKELKSFKILLEVESRLLEDKYKIDDNKNGIISYKELGIHKEELFNYVKKHFLLLHNHNKLNFNNAKVIFHRYQDQTYMSISKQYEEIDLDNLQLHYSLFFELEKKHKLLIHLDESRGDYILNQKNNIYNFSSFKISFYQRLKIFIVDGFFHILDGLDHLLFILMILIPSILLFQNREVYMKDFLLKIFKIITTFSIAHSITLFISGIGLYKPSVVFIESSIALSIFIVALMNFIGKYKHVNKKIVFAFGLLHGFGFANVLEIVKIDSKVEFLTALFGFNLGVEIGQIFIILILLPFIYLLSKNKFYFLVLKLISLAAIIISIFWFFQRAQLF